jgi:hypothetical protein
MFKRMKKSLIGLAAVATLAAAPVAILGGQAGAVGDSGTGSAFGVEVLPILPATPTVTLGADGAADSATLIPADVPGLLDVNAGPVSTSSTNFGTAAESITSTAGVAGDFSPVPGVDLLNSLDAQAVTTECNSVTGTDGSTGEADFLSLQGTEVPIPVNTIETAPGEPLASLSALLTVVANVQTVVNTPGNSSIQVIGLEITVLNDSVTIEGGVSNCGVTGPDVNPAPTPTITSFTPTSGPVAGGTVVTITGTNLTGTTGVTFCGAGGTDVTDVNSTTVEVTTPAAEGTGPCAVVVDNPNGNATAPTDFTYVTAAPTITSYTPTSGTTAGGTLVTITGTNLTGTTAVTFGGVAGTGLANINSTTVQVSTPAGAAGSVPVVLDNPNGDVTAAVAYTYVTNAPTITSYTPTSGTVGGGTVVTITGTNLTGTTGVTFGGVAGTGLANINSTTVQVTTPAGTAGSVPVILDNPNGNVTAAIAYTYVGNPPTIISYTPTSGTTAGGTLVTITGTNLLDSTAVTFCGVAAVLGEDTATTIQVSTPAEAAGTCPVVVDNPNGDVTAAVAYTYSATAPSVTSFTPTSGPVAGGTVVTLTGTNLSGTTGVTFGGVPGTAVTNVNATTVEVTTPASAAAESVSVVLTTPAGMATGPVGYTYTTATSPTITSYTPTSGPISGGTVVTITGTNLSGTTEVTFGGVAGTALANVNATTVEVTTPSVPGPTTVPVILTTPAGSVTATVAYTFTADAPTINATGISPTSGPIAGGTLVTITGTNLSGTTEVTFGGVAGTIPAGNINDTNTELQVDTPAVAAAETVPVTLKTPDGSVTAAQLFTYTSATAPTITSYTPITGTTAGGTVVTITGTNLTGTLSVTFGGAGAIIDSITATTVTVSTPAAAAGAVAVTLTTAAGAVTSPQAYTYVAPATTAPTLAGISPSSGPPSGGESVLLEGTNLCGATSVTFNGVIATITSTNSPTCTEVTVIEPPGSGTDVPVVITTAGGSATSPIPFTYIEAGYWEASGDGGVFSYGGAQFYGSVPGVLQPGQKLNSPIVAMADTPDHGGYWLFAADGGVFAFGDAPFLGSVPGVLQPGQKLNGPIVAAEATPDGLGYRMFATDGGVFDFGDAQFVGSLPGVPETPTAPIAAAVSSPIGQGYWLAGQDGNIYHFGSVPFSESGLGSFYGRVVAMAATPDGDGYYLFLQSGAVAHFGDATAGLGSASGDIVFGQDTSTGKGYWEFASNGAVSSFGDAPQLGQPNFALNAPVVAAIAFGETTS